MSGTFNISTTFGASGVSKMNYTIGDFQLAGYGQGAMLNIRTMSSYTTFGPIDQIQTSSDGSANCYLDLHVSTITGARPITVTYSGGFGYTNGIQTTPALATPGTYSIANFTYPSFIIGSNVVQQLSAARTGYDAALGYIAGPKGFLMAASTGNPYDPNNAAVVLPPSLTGYHGTGSGDVKVQLSDGTGTLNHLAIFNATGGLTDGGSGAGVSSINSTTGPFTFSFSAGAGSCTGTTCTFTGLGTGGGSVTNFIAGTWVSWLTPSVLTSTTTPVLSVAATTGLTANQFLATPNGSSGPVGLRTIVNADIPTTLTGITIDGVNPTTMGYVDPTSSIQTQLNVKQNALTNPVTGPGSGATIGHMAVMGNTSGTSITDGGAIPSVGTWGALNYPTWVSGAPFVKMTAAGTFALDTNTYLTSSGVSGMTSGQIPVAASGTTITSSKVLAGSGSGITTGPTSSTNLDCANFSGTGGQIADSGSPCGSGSGGLSGMTAGQVPVAATASTVTSSKALGGSGSGITTGPTSSISGDAAGFTGTNGQLQDLGYAPASALNCTTVSSLSPVGGGCYQLSTSSSVAMPAASTFANNAFNVQTESGATATFTGTTLSSDAGCSGFLSGSTLALTGNHAISVKSDGTNVWASCL